MATSAFQDEKFIRQVIDRGLLEKAMDWIANEFLPGDVFSNRVLTEWAEENGFVKPGDQS